jgi:hypothetical protein
MFCLYTSVTRLKCIALTLGKAAVGRGQTFSCFQSSLCETLKIVIGKLPRSVISSIAHADMGILGSWSVQCCARALSADIGPPPFLAWTSETDDATDFRRTQRSNTQGCKSSNDPREGQFSPEHRRSRCGKDPRISSVRLLAGLVCCAHSYNGPPVSSHVPEVFVKMKVGTASSVNWDAQGLVPDIDRFTEMVPSASTNSIAQRGSTQQIDRSTDTAGTLARALSIPATTRNNRSVLKPAKT